MYQLEVISTDIFDTIKNNITTREAAEKYGISVGRNGMCVCPFHDDHNPSMKVDKRFHCFGCQADGDVINFTARLYKLSQMEAALKLCADFEINDLASKVENAVHENDELLEKVKAAESRLQEIGELKKAIYDYLKTREVFAEWKKSNWSDAFFHAHEQELMLHKSAKKVFDTIGGKIPTIKELNAEYNSVLSEKQRDYAKYRETRDKMRELLTVKANIDIVTERSNAPESERKPSTIIH